jgi:hypothetical protein
MIGIVIQRMVFMVCEITSDMVAALDVAVARVEVQDRKRGRGTPSNG